MFVTWVSLSVGGLECECVFHEFEGNPSDTAFAASATQLLETRLRAGLRRSVNSGFLTGGAPQHISAAQ
jgi:hypothetical protein